MERSLCWTCTLQGIAMTTDSSLRTPAAEILPVPKMRKGARQSACVPEQESASQDPYPSGYRDDELFSGETKYPPGIASYRGDEHKARLM